MFIDELYQKIEALQLDSDDDIIIQINKVTAPVVDCRVVQGPTKRKRLVFMNDKSPMKLELGCGENPHSNAYIGIDIIDYGQEIIRDITKGIPFTDNTFKEVYACHVLEHIDKKDIRFVWEEIHRVLEPGGILIARMPHATDAHAILPEHLSQWNEQVVNVLCNVYGSKDHHTKTNFVILYLEHVKDELRFVIAKSSAPKASDWDITKVRW